MITHYLLDRITDFDVAKFGHAVGADTGQQTWEALTMLVALRTWRHVWAQGRACLTIQGDSITALYLLADTKSRSATNVHIAREVALELGSAAYRPDRIEHIPGLTNVIPDFLSRRSCEDYASRPWPDALRNATQVPVEPRGPSWYLAAEPPRPPVRRKRVYGRLVE